VTPPETQSDGAAAGVEALLSDGTVVAVRPATQEDLQGLLRLHRDASDESRRMRFFASGTAPAEYHDRRTRRAAVASIPRCK
jgi:hypothetical protein